MKFIYIALAFFFSMNIYAEMIYVSVISNDAKFKVATTGKLISEDLNGMEPLSFTYKIDKVEYEDADDDSWVSAGHDLLKIQKKFLVLLSKFKVVDANKYMQGCYFFTVGGDGRGVYLQSLSDGGVLFESDLPPYTNTGVEWPFKAPKTYGALLIYKDISVFRDGFGKIVANSAITQRNKLYAFETDRPNESYFKVDCH